MDNKFWNMLSGILVVIGGLNWGLVGLSYFINFNLNIVNILFTQWIGVAALEYIVYLVVGVAAVAHAVLCPKMCNK